MKKGMLLMVLVLSGAFVYGEPSKSFKLGMPYSTAQILLDDTKLAGRTLMPTLGLSFFSISSSSEYTSNTGSDKSDMSAHFLTPRLGARILGERLGATLTQVHLTITFQNR